MFQRSVIILIGTLCFLSHGLAQKIEAEAGTLTGVSVATQRSGYSGSGYVTGFDNDGDGVKFTITATAGLYSLSARYASASGDKNNIVKVNGMSIGSPKFPQSAVFTDVVLGKIFLKAGTNTLEIVKDWGYFDLDYIKLEVAVPAPTGPVAAAPVTPGVSTEADSLYQLLVRNYGKVILSGQYGGDSELNYIEQKSGKLPVIRGFDLIDYSPSRVAFGTSATEIEKAIAWNARGGIVTSCWHWNAPEDYLINTPGKEWWRGFYTEATTFDVSVAMNDASSPEYTLILRDIDAIAVQLKRLQAAGIPVLWRPLHEAEGAWFWWGAKGAAPCKWLWQLLYNRLVHEHNITNLLWVWTSTADAGALEWYPGDEYVDVVGSDIYLSAGDYSTSFAAFDGLATLYGGRKLLALTENGPIPEAADLAAQQVGWSWFSTWSGSFILDGTTNSAAHINTVYNHDYVITLDEGDALLEGEVVTGVIPFEEQVIQVFPNPTANGFVSVQFTGGQTASRVRVYNTAGGLLATEVPGHAPAVAVDLHDRPAGLYYLHIEMNDAVRIFKIIKR